MGPLMTQAAFAREIGVSRQRVGQLVKQGLPVGADGQLDAAKARAWLAENWLPDPSVQVRRERREERRAEDTQTRRRITSKRGADWGKLTDYGRGLVDGLNLIRHPLYLQVFEDVVVAVAGCGRETAGCVAVALDGYLAEQIRRYAAKNLKEAEARVVMSWD